MSRADPPLNALRAFEAAARHLNMTRAAEELHVTPAAVSHQVVALEELLGCKLFERKQRGLALTPAGAAYLPGLQDGFARIREATERLRQFAGRDDPLTISAPQAFSAKWLMPRLDKMREILPDVQIVNDRADREPNHGESSLQLAIRYGTGEYPGFVVEKLLDEAVFPVCSPKFLECRDAIERPEDLLAHTLLHGRPSFPGENFPDWRAWFAAAGVDLADDPPGLTFDHHWMTVEAALEAQGIALAKRTIVDAEIRRGRLVRLLDIDYPLNYGYFLVYPDALARRASVRPLCDWLHAEAASTTRSRNQR